MQTHASHSHANSATKDSIALKPKSNPTFTLVAGTLGIQILNTLLLLGAGVTLLTLALKPAPTLVQLVDGQPVQVSAKDHLERTPETIRRFTSDFINLMFSWRGTLPPQTIEQAQAPEPDPGIALSITNKNRKVATSAFQAAFALSEDFRKPFLESVAEMTPQELFASQKRKTETLPTQVVPLIKYISDPLPIKSGVWKVNVVANLVVFTDQDRMGKVTPFNKELSLRAVEPPSTPGDTPLEKQIFAIRRAGLEVFAIRDLDP